MNRALAFVVVLLIACASPAAWAHAYLDHAEPKVGSTGAAPVAVKIWFSETATLPGSKITVTDSGGTQVDKKDLHADANDDALLILSLPKLEPGTYTVRWEAVCVNHHHTHGSFEFSVAR